MDDTQVKEQKPAGTQNSSKMGTFFGELFAFNTCLKLYHWHVTGKASYAEHMALDQALESVTDTLDRIVETSIALYGGMQITVPESKAPDNIVDFVENFYQHIEDQRDMFQESFSDSIMDDYQEAIQQLLYRLRRLS